MTAFSFYVLHPYRLFFKKWVLKGIFLTRVPMPCNLQRIIDICIKYVQVKYSQTNIVDYFFSKLKTY